MKEIVVSDFKSLKSEFDIENKERSGRSKVYEDAELGKYYEDEDSCQTQKEFALTLGVTQQFHIV